MLSSNDNIDTIIRFVLIALIVFSALAIVSPFLSILIWAVIIAISSYPGYLWLIEKFGGRQGLAAAILMLLLLLIILIPVALSLPDFADSIRSLASQFREGTLAVPAAPEKLKLFPIVGQSVYDFWNEASNNIDSLFEQFKPQLKKAGVSVLSLIAAVGFFVVQFFIATIVAGVMLAHHEGGIRLVRRLALKIAPEASHRYLSLTENTVRGVTNGVIGVAVAQAILAGIGFVVMGVPAAALWAFACLVLAILQISITIIVIPIAIYVFSNYELLPAIFFLLWNVPILTLDNILKPMLMGMGVDAPMLVIFFGAIGGFISFGFLGLFLGAVILVIAYDLLLLWLGIASNVEPESQENQ